MWRIWGDVSDVANCLYLVVEKADLQDVLHVGSSVGHAEVAQRVAHQDDVAVVLQLLEVVGVAQGAVVFVVHVDQLAFEAPDDALREERSSHLLNDVPLLMKYYHGQVWNLRFRQSP